MNVVPLWFAEETRLLDEQYAKGNITKEVCERGKKDLLEEMWERGEEEKLGQFLEDNPPEED